MNHWVQTHTDSGSERFCVEPSQCFVQAVIGIDPIVMKISLWDQSQSLAYVVTGITSLILILG